jgi:hypothetical protein
MFGTFQEEEERPTYGITKPVNSWNAVWANFDHYATMAREIKIIPKFSDKVKYLFKKPGWLPAELGGYRPAPAVDSTSYRKYDTPHPVALNYYVLFQYVLCLLVTSWFLFQQKSFDLGQKAVLAALISIIVVNCGVLFEQKRWVVTAEWIRIILYPLGVVVWSAWHPGNYWLEVGAGLYLVVSVGWFYFVNRKLTPHAA